MSKKGQMLARWGRHIRWGVYVPLPGLHVQAMTLWPFVIYRPGIRALHRALLYHERIHLRQQRELFVLPFYLWYLGEYAWLRVVCGMPHRAAYLAIGFEREAYSHERDYGYLELRRPGWGFRRFYGRKGGGQGRIFTPAPGS